MFQTDNMPMRKDEVAPGTSAVRISSRTSKRAHQLLVGCLASIVGGVALMTCQERLPLVYAAGIVEAGTDGIGTRTHVRKDEGGHAFLVVSWRFRQNSGEIAFNTEHELRIHGRRVQVPDKAFGVYGLKPDYSLFPIPVKGERLAKLLAEVSERPFANKNSDIWTSDVAPSLMIVEGPGPPPP